MSNPFFSVIVPAYNAENHIRTLLDSIASQTFKDYELIVICDSCTDNTEQIAKSYGAVTERVAFGRDGLSRDRGLDMARGQWILFADDDDWYHWNDAFELLYNHIKMFPDNLDLIAFGYLKGTQGYISPDKENIFKPRVDHVWSSCWRRSRIGDARFGAAVFSSDTYFMKAMRSHVRGCAILNAPLYYYNFMRPGSQTDLFCKGIIRQSPVAE